MNKEEYDTLPIGTILIWRKGLNNEYTNIIIKHSKRRVRVLYDDWYVLGTFVGELSAFEDEYEYENVEIAPKHIREMFEVK